MRCAVAREQMDAVLDGVLTDPRAERLRVHLRDCPDCGPEFQARLELQAALRSLPSEPLPDGFEMRLHRRLAAAIPERRRASWWGGALPVATAVAGFLAAAAVAAPLLPAGGVQHMAATAAHAAAGGSAGGHFTPIQTQAPSFDQRRGTYAAPGASTAVINGANGAASVYGQDVPQPTPLPAGPRQADAASTAGSSAGAPGGGGTQAAFPKAPDVAGTANPSAATEPAALALTILAAEPMQAVADLSQLAAEGGGHVIATFPARPADSAPQGAPQPVATLDALIPASAADAYARRAGADGRILASVSSLPPAADPSAPNVRLLVTVLVAPSPTPAPQPHPALRSRAAGGSTAGVVLRDAGRAAPWAAGAAAVGLLIWGAGRVLRRP